MSFVVASCGNPEILANGEPIEHARDLGLDTDAETGNFVRLQVGDVGAAEEDRAAGGPELTGQHLEERALARAVRPDETAQLPFSHREVDIADGLDAAEAHLSPRVSIRAGSCLDLLCLDRLRLHLLSGTAASRDAGRLMSQGMTCSVTIGAMPLGTSRTKPSRIAPSMTLAGMICWVPASAVSQEMAKHPITGPSGVPAPPTINQIITCADCTMLKTVGLT